MLERHVCRTKVAGNLVLKGEYSTLNRSAAKVLVKHVSRTPVVKKNTPQIALYLVERPTMCLQQ